MSYEGKTKAFLMENATTKVYSHVEKEIASGTINGTNKTFTVTTAPVSVTGLSASALSQYVDSDGDYFRKDVLVYYRLNNADTVVNTNSNAITISGTSITFATAPETTDADYIIVSYSHTETSRTDEIINVTFSGGDRPDEFITVQGGEKVRIGKIQNEKTIALEVLSVDNGFVQYVNGTQIQETIAGATSGSDYLQGTVGSGTRSPKTIVIKVDDPDTDNDRIECFFNVYGISDDGSAPSDGYIQENCSFQCPPQDYCRLTRLVGQGD